MRLLNLLCLPILVPLLLWAGILWLFLFAAKPARARQPLVALLAAILLIPLNGCSTTPTQNEIAAITNACAIDSGIRPIVTELLAVPGLATPAESLAVTTARAVIDPICANPSATPQANALSALTGASAQIIGIVTVLKARQAPSASKTAVYRFRQAILVRLSRA